MALIAVGVCLVVFSAWENFSLISSLLVKDSNKSTPDSVKLRNLKSVRDEILAVNVTAKTATATNTASEFEPAPAFSEAEPENILHEDTYYANVVLVGQFNYDTDPNLVAYWYEKWSQYFKIIQVRGPFSNETTSILRKENIQVYWGAKDQGKYSPTKNLGDALRMYAHDETIDGVIMAHDDLIFNMTYLKEVGFPNNVDILSQAPMQMIDEPKAYFYNATRYKTPNNDTIHTWSPDKMEDHHDFVAEGFRYWCSWGSCLPQFGQAAFSDPRGLMLSPPDKDGAVAMFGERFALGDFVYVSRKYAERYAELADWMVDNNVYLECGTSTIVSILKHRHNARVTHVTTCNRYAGKRKNVYPEMLTGFCDWSPPREKNVTVWGLYHPAKLSTYPLEIWGAHFDVMTGNRSTLDPNVSLPLIKKYK